MIFEALAAYLKPHLNAEKSLKPLLTAWMRKKLINPDPCDHLSRVLQAEFKLIELKKEKVFMVVPRSERANNLIAFLQEYVAIMEETRQDRLSGIPKSRKRSAVKTS
ncbi:MAG: hypothetical protein SFT81_00730 [Candidatus Caenarcaniphilales bacterium]|nr:hypothetical protein [Candidatus Caenarcaniphilales bacterium]